jgi:succinoglycan biosynthesis transport protein ExoP
MTQHTLPLLPNRDFHGGKEDASDLSAGLAALFTLLWYKKWVILGVMTVFVALTVVYVFGIATAKYRSTSVVILETRQNTLVGLPGFIDGLSGEIPAVNSELEVLRARTLMSEVADSLNLATDAEFNRTALPQGVFSRVRAWAGAVLFGQGLGLQMPKRNEQDAVVSALLSKVSVRNVPKSLVFQISVETADPIKSARIADQIAETYIKNQIKVKFDASTAATSWLAERVANLKALLEDAEVRAASFSSSTNLISVASLQALERQIKELRRRIATTRDVTMTLSGQIAAMQTASTPLEMSTAANDPKLMRLMIALESGEIAYDGFVEAFGSIQETKMLDANRAWQKLKSLQASEARLEAQIESQANDLIVLQQLTRDAEANRLLYEHFLSRLKEISAQQGIQQADSRVLSNAVMPTRPVSPNRSLLVSIAAILGVATGIGYVLYREARRQSFRTAQDLEFGTGKTVFGQIPLMPIEDRRQLLPFLCADAGSAVAEAVRNLRTSIMHGNTRKTPQVLVISSALPGEGKTTTSLAIAHSFSRMGKKVLLIEGDMRRRLFHEYFEKLPPFGLVSLLNEEKSLNDVLFKTPYFGADILPAEDAVANAADCFASHKFSALIEKLRKQYDVIIIDTPPVLVVPDARVIAQCADAIFLAVKWDSTTQQQLDEVMRLLRNGNLTVTGLVLNQIDPKGMKRYGYGDRQGIYGAYGSEYYAA